MRRLPVVSALHPLLCAYSHSNAANNINNNSLRLCSTTPSKSGTAASSSSSPTSALKVKVYVTDQSGKRQASYYAAGKNLMESIRDDPTTMADIQGVCNSCLDCSTCHVYIDGEWHKRLEALLPTSEKENDTLDKAVEVKENSRLACQIVLSENMEGLEVSMPKAVRDARWADVLARATANKK